MRWGLWLGLIRETACDHKSLGQLPCLKPPLPTACTHPLTVSARLRAGPHVLRHLPVLDQTCSAPVAAAADAVGMKAVSC